MDSNQTGQKISAEKLMGGASSSLGKVGQGGESKVGKLARIVRTTRVKVNENEKKITINVEKISNNYDSIEEVTESLNSLHEQMVEQMLNKMDEEKKEEEKGDKVTGESVEGISKSLDVIAVELASLGTLMADNLKQRKQQADQDRLEDQKKKQAKEEAKAEKQKKKERGQKLEKLGGFVKKITFFDQIKKFFGSILAGSAILGFFKWIKDPENQKKYNEFIDFFADKVPLIIAGIAAFLALNVASSLIGVITTLTGLVTGLAVALGPAGLLAILIAAGGLLATIGIIKGREALMDYMGGVGFTSTGLAFGYQDIQDITQSKLDQLDRKVNAGDMTIEQAREAKKPYDNLMKLMRQRKQVNDKLAGVNKYIESLQERIARQRKEGDDNSADRNQGILDTQLQIKKDLEQQLPQINRQVTLAFDQTGITEQEVMDSVQGRGAEVVRMPESVAPDLRKPRSQREAVVQSGASGASGFPDLRGGNGMVDGHGNIKMDALYGEDSPINLDSFMTSNLKVEPPNFSAKAMEFGKDPINFEIGTPLVQTPKIIPFPTNGQASGNMSGATSNQSSVPAFSAVDPNNPLITTTTSIYNSVN